MESALAGNSPPMPHGTSIRNSRHSVASLARVFHPFPEGLEPDHEEVIPMLGVRVPSVNIVLKRWKGTRRIKDELAGKPVAEFDRRPMFVELAVIQIAARSGWKALWQQAYPIRKGGAPSYYAEWREDASRKDQALIMAIDSPYHQQLQESIARYNGNSFRGCWDLIAWNEGEENNSNRTIYVKLISQSKSVDTMRCNQLRWFSACISAGLKSKENFLLVKWRFDDP